MPNALSAIVADGNNIVVGGDGGTLHRASDLAARCWRRAFSATASLLDRRSPVADRCSWDRLELFHAAARVWTTTVAGGSAPALSSLAPGLSGEVMAAGHQAACCVCSKRVSWTERWGAIIDLVRYLE